MIVWKASGNDENRIYSGVICEIVILTSAIPNLSLFQAVDRNADLVILCFTREISPTELCNVDGYRQLIKNNCTMQTNTRLCLSISDFHPDTWNPAWTVGTIVTGAFGKLSDCGR